MHKESTLIVFALGLSLATLGACSQGSDARRESPEQLAERTGGQILQSARLIRTVRSKRDEAAMQKRFVALMGSSARSPSTARALSSRVSALTGPDAGPEGPKGALVADAAVAKVPPSGALASGEGDPVPEDGPLPEDVPAPEDGALPEDVPAPEGGALPEDASTPDEDRPLDAKTPDEESPPDAGPSTSEVLPEPPDPAPEPPAPDMEPIVSPGPDDDVLVVTPPDPGAERVDIGEAAAREVFEAAIARLREEGAPEVEGVDLTQVRVTRRMRGSGRPGQPSSLKVRVRQYIFTAQRVANGLPIADSMLAIAVARDGDIASVRTKGMVPEVPSDAPRRRARGVASSAIRARLLRENPGAEVESLGLQYIPGASTAQQATDIVEPLEVFMVFPSLDDPGGRGRGFRVAYSVTDPNAPAVEL